MGLKKNWNKPPMISHKRIIDICFAAWGFITVALLILGINALVAIFVPAGIIAACYFFARLTP